MKELMTRDEFLEYAQWVLGEGAESLYEQLAEYNSEVAMFGDAGPGAGLRLHQAIAEYNGVARQYARLTNTTFVPFRGVMRSPA